MRYLSLFDGIGAATCAWRPMGWECVGVSEVDAFPIAVTSHHYPDVPHLGDVTKITEDQVRALGRVDLIVGGFPCQDLSVAGKRTGLRNEDGSATRSGLFFDAMRVVRWARQHCGLRWLLIENVPGLYSSNKGRDFAAVVGEMVGAEFGVPRDGWRNAGVAVGPDGLCEWATLDAQFFNVAQRRVRVFALADFGNWADRSPVLFERHSLLGHPAPRREAGEGAARGVAQGAGERGRWPAEVSPTLNAAFGKKLGLEDQHALGGAGCFVPAIMSSGQANAEIRTDGGAPSLTCLHEAPIVAHALRGEGFDAGEDGTGRGTPLVPCVAPTLDQRAGRSGANSFATSGGLVPVAQPYTLAIRGRGDSHDLEYRQDGTANALLTPNGGRGGIGVGAIAFAQNQRDEVRTMDVAGALAAEPGAKQQTYIAFSSKDHGADAGPISPTLRSMGHDGSHANGGGQVAVAFFQGDEHGRMGGRTPQSQDDLPFGAVREVRGSQGGSASQERGLDGSSTRQPSTSVPQLSHESAQVGSAVPIVREATQGLGVLRDALPAIQDPRRSNEAGLEHSDALQGGGLRTDQPRAQPLQQACPTTAPGDARTATVKPQRASQEAMAGRAFQVRRLTPVECERLQGFPDQYTNVPYRGKPAADGPRYKALGNSFAVPVVRWIGERIQRVEAICSSAKAAA